MDHLHTHSDTLPLSGIARQPPTNARNGGTRAVLDTRAVLERTSRRGRAARAICNVALFATMLAACGDGAETTAGGDTSSGGTGGMAGAGGTGGTGGSEMSTSGPDTTGGAGGTGGSDTTGASAGGSGGSGGSNVGDNDEYIYPPGSTIAGKTYGEWGATWWQWALAIPGATNPIKGGACDQQQPDGAFFLAGNTGGKVTRDCALPSADTPIFFPLVNVYAHSCPENSCASTPEKALAVANDFYSGNEPLKLILEIDGVTFAGLDAYMAPTGSFDDTQSADPGEQVFPGCAGPIPENMCGIPVGSPRSCAGNGYWIMLRPLASGQHVVRLGGVLSNFWLDVTYNLTIP